MFGQLVLTALTLMSGAHAQEVNMTAYGAPCTPQVNPFRGNAALNATSKRRDCGACLLARDCEFINGRPLAPKFATGCESFTDSEIQCCTNKEIDDNSCRLDPAFPVFFDVTSVAPVKNPNRVNFAAGSFIVTKASLRDSPQRYWSIVEQVIAKISKTPHAPQIKEGSFYRVQVDCPAVGFSPDGLPWRNITIDPVKSTITILGDDANPNSGGIRIDAHLTIELRCRYSIRAGLCGIISLLCFEKCQFSNSISTLRHTSIVPVTVRMLFDPVTKQLVVNPSVEIDIKYDDFAFSCGGDLLMYASELIKEFVDVDIKNLFSTQLNAAIKEAANQTIGLPQEFRPIENLMIGYRLDNMKFYQDKSIILAASINISAVFPDGVRKFYEFPDNYHNVIAVPEDWDALLVDQSNSPLLNGARFNVDIVTAAAGVFSMLYSSFSNSTTIFDAKLDYSVLVGGPQMSVTSRNILTFLLPVGQMNAKCDSDPQRGKSLVDASFSNIKGSIALEYIAGDTAQQIRPGIVIQYKSVDVRNSSIKIVAPPLPISGDVLQRAIESALNGRQETLNNFLRQNPLSMPAQVVPYFPYPFVSALPVQGAGGYVEFRTQCLCNAPKIDAIAARKCRAKACRECVSSPECVWCDLGPLSACYDGPMCQVSSIVPLRNLTKCPDFTGGFNDGCTFKCGSKRRSFEESIAKPVTASNVVSGSQHPIVIEPICDHNEIELHKRHVDQSTMQYAVTAFSNDACSMRAIGSRLRAMLLADTNGACQKHSAAFYLATDAAGPFYSIKTYDGKVDVQLACSVNCAVCAIKRVDMPLNSCVSSDGGRDVSWVLQTAENPCIGARGQDMSGIYGLFTTKGDNTCAGSRFPLKLLPPDSIQLMQAVSLGTMDDATKLSMCNDFNSKDVLKQSWAQMSLGANSVSNVKLECDPKCANCNAAFSEPLPYDVCVTPAMLLKAATDNGVPQFAPSYFVSSLRTCVYVDKTNSTISTMRAAVAMNVTSVDQEKERYNLGLQLILPAAIIVGIAAIVGLVRAPKAAGIIDPGHSNSLAGFRAYVQRHSWTIGRPGKGTACVFIFNILALVLAVIEAMIWSSTNPINVLDDNVVQNRLGVSSRFVKTDGFTSRFGVWTFTGNITLWMSVVGIFLLLLDNLITRKHLHDRPADKGEKSTFGRRARKNLWFLIMFLHAAMLLGLPLQTAFGVTDSVKVDPDGSQIVEKAAGGLELVLGIGAGLIMFNVILGFFVNLLQMIPAGLVLGTTMYLFDKGTSTGDGGIVVSRGIWVTSALITVTSHMMIPIALSPAVLIFVHRHGMNEYFWVGLVWLFQWVVGLLCVGLALFRRVQLATTKGDVVIRSQRYIILYGIVIAVTTFLLLIAEFRASKAPRLVAFLLFYRFATFFVVACFFRTWLEAYRPRWSREILVKARKEAHEDAERKEQELAQMRQTGTIDIRSKSKSSKELSGVAKVIRSIEATVFAPISMLCYLVEADRPPSSSLPYRRTWLFVGVLAGVAFLMDSFVKLISMTPKEVAIQTVKDNSDVLFGIEWPSDEDGGAIFDPAFNLYNILRWVKFLTLTIGVLICIGMLIDDFRAARSRDPNALQRSVVRQQKFGFFVLILVYLGTLTPSIPDYPRVAKLTDILPACGVEFTDLVLNIYGALQGFILTALTMFSILPILITVMPALLRGVDLIVVAQLKEDQFKRENEWARKNGCLCRMVWWSSPTVDSPPGSIDHAFVLFQFGTFLSPLIIGPPMLFFFVFLGDRFMIAMFMISWIMPMATTYLLPATKIDLSYNLATVLFYYVPILAVVLQQAISRDILTLEFILSQLSKWSTYASLLTSLTEYCLTNVIVSDVIFLLIWSLYPEHTDARLAAEAKLSEAQQPIHAAYNAPQTLALGPHTVLQSDGTTLLVANPVHHMAAAPPQSSEIDRTQEKIRQLDSEFGGERYGKEAPAAPPGGWAAAAKRPAPLLSSNSTTVAAFPTQVLEAPMAASPAFPTEALYGDNAVDAYPRDELQQSFNGRTVGGSGATMQDFGASFNGRTVPGTLQLGNGGTLQSSNSTMLMRPQASGQMRTTDLSSSSFDGGTISSLNNATSTDKLFTSTMNHQTSFQSFDGTTAFMNDNGGGNDTGPGGAFKCGLCERSYPQLSDLTLHMAKRHPEVDAATPASSNPYG